MDHERSHCKLPTQNSKRGLKDPMYGRMVKVEAMHCSGVSESVA
jgi:hypothetical protein